MNKVFFFLFSGDLLSEVLGIDQQRINAFYALHRRMRGIFILSKRNTQKEASEDKVCLSLRLPKCVVSCIHILPFSRKKNNNNIAYKFATEFENAKAV